MSWARAKQRPTAFPAACSTMVAVGAEKKVGSLESGSRGWGVRIGTGNAKLSIQYFLFLFCPRCGFWGLSKAPGSFINKKWESLTSRDISSSAISMTRSHPGFCNRDYLSTCVFPKERSHFSKELFQMKHHYSSIASFLLPLAFEFSLRATTRTALYFRAQVLRLCPLPVPNVIIPK